MCMHIMLIPFSNMHIGSPSLLKVRTKAITSVPGTSGASNGIENENKKGFVCLTGTQKLKIEKSCYTTQPTSDKGRGDLLL